ncbi:MAG: hypothetical protein GKR93_12160 [Gammaproteobacteria bacterium]|nr:hypothetical protein [Gammaproteobacteria bacterium]
MAKKTDTLTTDLFASAPDIELEKIPGALSGLGCEISGLVAQILKEHPGDRHELAAKMSQLAGKDITKSMLDGYTAESRENFNIPFYLAIVLEQVTGNHLLSSYFAKRVGGQALFGRQTVEAEIGRYQLQKQQADTKIKSLTKKLKNGAINGN